MVSELPHEFRKFSRNCSHLRRILKETNRCLDEITSGEREHALTIAALEKIAGILECHPALVVLGQSCNAKACLVNALLGEALLPLGGSLWRWIRIQYGLTSHIALTLGQQFEVVEHLHVNEKPWTTLPEDDLRRSECDERIQGQCIQKVILSAFDMAREIQITPRRILYAQKKEGELYKNLMAISNEKQEEITQLIQVTLKDMKDNLVEKAGDYCYQGVTLSDSEEIKSAQSVHIATVEIQNWVLSWLSDSVASQLVKSVDCLQDTFVGTLQRCLESLEKNCQDQEGSLLASAAVKQILSAAYNVELTTSTSSSVLHSFIERLRKLLYGLQLPWTQAPRLDSEWRKRVATEMLNSLNAARLARSISAQFRDRVRSSHEAFQTAIHSLESHYTGHLVRTEEQRVAIRKLHAPRLARLSLESTSLSDMVQYGKLT
uniref:Uncharacterized protein n=1 Tax=Timema tahoe TaxID=61484 RepID=A0A7R9IQJ1_9NEOP|nr:unnamed protein product [Timema tahoe]